MLDIIEMLIPVIPPLIHQWLSEDKVLISAPDCIFPELSQ